MMPLSMGEQKTVMSAAGLRMLEVGTHVHAGYSEARNVAQYKERH